ncbi:orotidine-5'-phosphate decarboxylase [Buchnera aphidicola (Pemphigus obesinymphae)]|uniref:orotidine-5'-phosphate decarboxylase n=1 Tax=Buchnera aphidicola TaxID=9 RepID=UPI002237762E|nr:orotidine-5'-phosphate decarboxylase [Buchnera aphidicola]MCW5196505.1 orotidine-5'-phosphate decarboxylase [Buchnera aphidicola (Pemphigus obesinymphae)]
MSEIISKFTTKIIIALDYSDKNKAFKLINNLDPAIYRLKIGKRMFSIFGRSFIVQLKNLGFDIFLDLKFHDIPNTVFGAVSAAADLGVWMISIHISGGSKMLQAAKLALNPFKKDIPLLIGITVLTSFNEQDLREIGVNSSITDQVLMLSTLAKKNGLDGVVCPGTESMNVKKKLGFNFKVISPAIRLKEDPAYDQQKVITPSLAKKFYVDYIVVGRTVTFSKNPLHTLKEINSFL